MPEMHYQIQGQNNWNPIAANTTPHVLLGTVAKFRLAGVSNAVEVTKTFNATGSQTIEATAGTDKKSVNVMVFSLTPTLTFADNFTGRSLTDVGVCERVTLGVTIAPATVNAASAGGLKWRIGRPSEREDGTVQKSETNRTAPGADGAACYIAPVCTASVPLTFLSSSLTPNPAQLTKIVTLELRVQGGFSAGLKVQHQLTVHTPQAVMVDQRHQYRHESSKPSAGFIGDIHLLPKTVSFSKIEWREAGGKAKAFANSNPSQPGGYFIWDHGKAHVVTGTSTTNPNAKSMQVGGGNTAAGCRIAQMDSVWTGWNESYPNPYDQTACNSIKSHGGYAFSPAGSIATNVPSTMTWEILWQYRAANVPNESWIVFQKAEHKAVMDAAGTVTISKGGASKTFLITHDPQLI
jgi:hypothetical protein